MIVIDPGHGGTDPGAIADDIVEKDYNLLISQYQYDRFQEMGVPVVMTRTTDETLTPTERVQRILNAFGNNPDVVVISNHLNASGGQGAEVIYALRNNDRLANLILNEIAKEGQVIRDAYQRRLPSDTAQDYYFIHRNTGITEPVIVEYAFVDGPPADQNQIKNNWRNLAEAVVRAVSIYKNLPFQVELEGNVYIVEKGDTLYSLARRFNVSVNAIKEANNLTSDLLSIGQKLIIPGLVPPSLETVSYVVQKGDTLYAIANRYNTTVNEIMAQNNLTSTTLSIGQILKIPTAVLPVIPPIEPPPIIEEPTTISYTVKAGDSLYALGQRYGTTVNEIMALNNLTTTKLSIGQQLLIPLIKTETGTITYTVKRGDNLWNLARTYNTTVAKIRTLNGLKTDLLSIGQQLIIPVSNSDLRLNNQVNGLSPILPLPNIIRYTVQRNDSLATIAEQFGTTVASIQLLNDLPSSILQVGQQLLIPTEPITELIPLPPNVITYKVQKGDTLWGIATKHGLTVATIKEFNNLTTDFLNIDQELKLPLKKQIPLLPETTIYVVQRGDTLASIANRLQTSVSVLKTLNKLETNNLEVGQLLFIPLNNNVETTLQDQEGELKMEDRKPSAELPLIIRYTVQRGDTLTSIATKYETTPLLLKQVNNLTTDVLRVGQELLVPQFLVSETELSEPTVAIYRVQSGDTLWSIARRFGTTVSIIKELNNLKDNLIRIDQELLVPIIPPLIIPPGQTTYIVKKNDTLYAIAKQYETTVSELQTLNNLDSDLINIGQILLVPLKKQGE